MRGTKVVSGAAIALLAFVSMFLGTAPASAEDPALLGLTKTASVAQASPGDTFSYTLQASCVYAGVVPKSGCTNAQIVDNVPAQFEVLSVAVTNYAESSATFSGQVVTVLFQTPFDDPAGSKGMLQGSNATVSIQVRVRDIPYEQSGIAIPNTATFTASNPDTDPATATVNVTPIVPLTLATTITKAFDPSQGVYLPGTPVDLDLTAANTSSTGVNSLVITEPADPTASPNPFDSLALTGIDMDGLPADADAVQVDVYTPSGWVIGTPGPTPVVPASVDPADVLGVRVTFTSSTGTIDTGEDVDLTLHLEQRDVGPLDDDLPVPNTASSTVSRDGQSQNATDSDTYTIIADIPVVAAGKSITPTYVAHGDDVNMELTATNDWVSSMTGLAITEPAITSDEYSDGFSEAMSFEGFSDTPPTWPSAADSASVTYYYADGTSETIPFAEGVPIPDPTSGEDVVRFRVDFFGDIAIGATAIVDATIGTDPDDPAPLTTITNTATAEGTAPSGAKGTDDASDTFNTFLRIVTPTQDKTIVPSTILGEAGEWVVLELNGGTAPPPDEVPETDPYSTGNANTITIQDPLPSDPDDPTSPPVASPFWDAFSPSEIADVGIPSGATLDVNYWNGTAWVPLAGPISGSTTWSYDIAGNAPPTPADIGGLQFVFNSDAGFPPGTALEPNVVMNLDDTDLPYEDGSALVENCASTSLLSSVALAQAPASDCASVNVIDPDNPPDGVGDFVDKDLLDTTIPARTGDLTTGEIDWSTGGYSNIESMTISDIPNPQSTPVSQSFYNAFDLYAVGAILPPGQTGDANATIDPNIAYDAVQSVQRFSAIADSWIDLETNPCATASDCYGRFPGATLSEGERADTLGIRLVFVENPNRSAITDPAAPPVGSGVARSINNDRPINLVFQIRDNARDGSGTVTGHRDYNDLVGEPIARNDVEAVAFDPDRPFPADDASDVIVIDDVPLAVSLDKTWTGGPLAIPPVGTAAADFPSGRVTLTATNATPALVDSMTITDPIGGGDEPFDSFDLTDIVGFTVPQGATGWTVTFDRGVSSIPVSGPASDTSALFAVSEADLRLTTGITVEFTGRIAADAKGVLTLDLQLREDLRSGGTVEQGTVPNTAVASVDDAGRDPESQPVAPTDTDFASMAILPGDIGMTVQKGFAPTASDAPQQNGFSQTEPDNDTFAMTLTAFPTGSLRAASMTVLDDDPTFWNAYEFVGFDPAFTFASPIDQVQVDAFSGATFTGELGGPDVSVAGGAWTPGTPGATPAIDGSVSAASVQGLRITYTRADGDQWENSETPHQQIHILVKRRANLLTGDPVPSDLSGNEAAPGETAAGLTENTISGSTESFLTDEDGVPLATGIADDVTADVRYAHSPTSVTVTKEPEGDQVPGTVIPFTLTITNDGATPIFNPVVVDTFPLYGGDPALILNPGEDFPYAFALTGAADLPDGWTPVPTDDSDVTVTATSGGVTFSFPDGSALDIGQTYTITIDMVVTPGVPANTDLTNEFSVSGDRDFDACNGDEQDPAAAQCTADATVDLLEAAAIRSGKLVRADDDSLGVFSVLDGVTCVPNADGFYAPPCVPITAPNGLETWRLAILNTGTIPLTQLVLMDRLPTVGDTGVLNPAQRGSAWTPELTQALVGENVPDSGTVEVFGTTGEPCADDLTPLEDTCPPGAWVDIATLDLSEVTALKFVVNFSEEEPFAPGDILTVDYETRTPLVDPDAGANPIAWNTVATGAVATNGAEVLPIEGNKVGVALATGPIAIEKLVSGNGADLAPDEFPVDLTCTIDGTVVFEQDGIVLTPGEPQTIEDIPLGAECSIVDSSDQGQTDVTSTSAIVVQDPTVIPVAQLTNIYDLAQLTIEKVLDTDAVDENGDTPPLGPFFVVAMCTFNGEYVYADGYGTFAPMFRFLEPNEPWNLTGLPAGASCVVRELGAAGATATSIAVTDANGDTTVEGNRVVIDLAPESQDFVNVVTITNAYDVGSLHLIKRVIGPGASSAKDPITLHVECVMETVVSTQTVYSGDVVLAAPFPAEATIDNLPAGADCTVTEPDNGGASKTVLLPGPLDAGSATVTIAADDTVQVTATNYFDPEDVLPVTGWDGLRLAVISALLLGFGFALVVAKRR